METYDLLKRLFAHMAWADRRLVALLGADDAPGAATRLFSHVLAAERVWLLRLQGRDTRGEQIWPELGPGERSALARENHEGYAAYLASVAEGALGEEVSYTNQQGQPYRTPVGDILLQVATHGTYHRGQVAAVVRAAGGDPVATDYILFSREGAPGAA